MTVQKILIIPFPQNSKNNLPAGFSDPVQKYDVNPNW